MFSFAFNIWNSSRYNYLDSDIFKTAVLNLDFSQESTLIPSVGDLIAEVVDANGSELSVTQSDVGLQPSKGDTINGLNALRFNGKFMQGIGNQFGDDDFSLFIVEQSLQAQDISDYIIGTDYGTSPAGALQIGYSNDVTLRAGIRGIVTIDTIVDSYDIRGIKVYNFERVGNVLSLYINGVFIQSEIGNQTILGNLVIGTALFASTLFSALDSLIGQVLIFDSNDNNEAITAKLIDKWIPVYELWDDSESWNDEDSWEDFILN